MNEVKFYLEKRKDKQTGQLIEKNVPILLFYSFKGKRLQYYTSKRTDARAWDEENMRVRRNYTDAADTNRELLRLEARVEDLYNKAKALDIEPTVEYFKENLNGNFNSHTVKKTFVQYFDEYIEKSALKHSKSLVTGLKITLALLKEYSKIANYSLSFEKINSDFYDSLLDYCFNRKQYFNNYTGKIIKDIKAFMNWATDKGYNSNMEFLKFIKLREEPEIIFLHYEEVLKLLALELDGALCEIRDLYCAGCLSGLRHSDLINLIPENVQKDQFVFRIKKTTENNSVPLNNHLRAILKRNKGKYPGKCLPQLGLKKANELLEKLIVAARIERNVQIVKYRGAQRFDETLPLKEAITFHTSKKTFMTNFLSRGGSLHTAMAITGNTDYKTAKRYFKVVDTLKKEESRKVFGK